MTFAAKHFDPIVGIDFHTYNGSLVPKPTPTFFIVFDVFDYLPKVGTIYVDGVMRAVAGSSGVGFHVPVWGAFIPHLLTIPCGPQLHDVIFLGSRSVAADDEPFARSFVPVLNCQLLGSLPPVRQKKTLKIILIILTLPTAMLLPLPSSVRVGGSLALRKGGVIDSSEAAVVHYYWGGGETAELGPATQELIRNSEDMERYRRRIEDGLTESPAEGSVSIDMEGDFWPPLDWWRGFHVGDTPLKYKTVCDVNTGMCTTTYTVLEGDGFWDIVVGNDHEGGAGEFPGGTPYAYEGFSWSETYPNPGYDVDENGRPSKK